MSSSSSSQTFQSDEQQATTDADNSDNHESFYNGRSESCPDDLIRDPEAHKIIWNRGIRDGLYMRTSIPHELMSVDTSNETVENVAMTNVTNFAVIVDLARTSSSIAMNAARLATELTNVSTDVDATELMVNVALDAAEATKTFANVARSISRRSRRSHDDHGLHG
ncbi:PREDICTED: uncharacterized protein LOC107168859 [Diuraphis noxia]|uniref:uncharacterized protein LOC107168859 n=1 Tax=Diuraphis noxia TaxID=143948 RepID=UPI00076386FA|nr:PREDICTED: uncharacterized protein LOC107168859 [Diuraphis noxia]